MVHVTATLNWNYTVSTLSVDVSIVWQFYKTLKLLCTDCVV